MNPNGHQACFLGRRIDLGATIGSRDLFPGNQSVTVIHEDMTHDRRDGRLLRDFIKGAFNGSAIGTLVEQWSDFTDRVKRLGRSK